MGLIAAGCAGWYAVSGAAGGETAIAAPGSPPGAPSPYASGADPAQADSSAANHGADPDHGTETHGGSETDADKFERLAAEVDANPSSRSARWNYGFMLFRHGRIEEADRQFVAANELGPDAYAALMRGVIAEQQLRYADAKQHYQDATSLPGNAESARQARENLALLGAHLAELQRFLQVDRRLDRDLLLALVAIGGFAGVLLWTTRRR